LALITDGYFYDAAVEAELERNLAQMTQKWDIRSWCGISGSPPASAKEAGNLFSGRPPGALTLSIGRFIIRLRPSLMDLMLLVNLPDSAAFRLNPDA
jgi:hypothetical protein